MQPVLRHFAAEPGLVTPGAPVLLARHAMATRFEIALHGDNPVALRAAGEEALDEIERLEDRLSLFRPASEISHLNARAAREAVRVTPGLFALLEQAWKLYEETAGAFDITVAPLVRCWGFMDGTGRIPAKEELAEARAKVGMHLVQLERRNFSVRFAREGVMIDLGAIGKGYAMERAAEVLREAGVTSALLHGGTSTVYALGHPPEAADWKVAVGDPQRHRSGEGSPGMKVLLGSGACEPGQEDLLTSPLAVASLKDEALSVSAVWGRFFEAGGKAFGHVIDPRTGEPSSGAVLAAVVVSSATESDALSTALLTSGSEGHEAVAKLRANMRTLLVTQSAGRFRIEARGIDRLQCSAPRLPSA